MADRTLQILPGGQSSAPFTYTVPASSEFDLLAVRAVFDGTGAAGAFLPAIQIFSDAGVLMAQTFASSVAAGTSADATFAPFLASEEAGGGAFVFSYDTLILSLGVDAFYKLDEVSGSTAHDSSGNGHNISATTTTPTWASAISPLGTPAPLFGAAQSFGGPAATLRYLPNLAGDFTICGWIQAVTEAVADTMYVGIQGDVPTVGGRGWGLNLNYAGTPVQRTEHGYVGDGAGGAHDIAGNSQYSKSVWYHLALRHSGTTWTLWVNGVQQTATYSGVYASTISELVVGSNNSGGFYLSYVLLFASALSATAIANLAGV